MLIFVLELERRVGVRGVDLGVDVDVDVDHEEPEELLCDEELLDDREEL